MVGGRSLTVKIALGDADGRRIPDAEALGLLAQPCRVRFVATGAQTASGCMKYDIENDQFSYRWKLGQQAGDVAISVQVGYPGTTAMTSLGETITVTR